MKPKTKKLKILMLNYEFPPLGGGASPVSYEIAKGYAKLGHQVDVVTMNYKGLKNFEKKDGINVYRIKCLRSKKEICHPHELLSYIVMAKKFLKNHMKTYKYDICHCHFIIPTGAVALWLKKRYGLDYVLTSHGSDVLGYNKRFKKLYPFLVRPWKRIIQNAKVVTTPSKFLEDEIRKLVSYDKFKVIPNGIDPKRFSPMKKEKRILVVARLFENKGIQDILDALKGLDLKGWKVDIVGEGPYRRELEKKVKDNKLEDVVKFHGWVENDSKKMRGFYGRAKVFISASYFENMSIVLLEALASGCNVLASDVGGNPEVVTNKEDLFGVKNSEELREKIKFAMRRNSRVKNNIKRFDWENIVKEYVGVLG